MSGEFFKGVVQWQSRRQGMKFKLPTFYRDLAFMTAVHTASTGKVSKLLPHPGMTPIEIRPGRCLTAFTAFEYRDSDAGAYNEVSIAFLITFSKSQIPGVTAARQIARRAFSVYVWQLPVTTEKPRLGGVEFFGYPKYLADITFDKGKEWVECRLSEGGKEVLSLKGKVPPTARGKTMKYTTYSLVDQAPVVAVALTDPLEYAESREKTAAILRLGEDHPVARTLRGIDLSPRPLRYQFSPLSQLILFPARNLIDN